MDVVYLRLAFGIALAALTCGEVAASFLDPESSHADIRDGPRRI